MQWLWDPYIPFGKLTIIQGEDDFRFFLKSIVRDYLAVDDPAKITKEDFVDKVESGAA